MNIYKEILSPLGVKNFKSDSMDMCWRFSFLVPGAKKIGEELRKYGIKLSHWYPPLDKFFPRYKKSSDLKISYRLGEEVCNLWLDNTITEKDIDALKKAVLDLRRRLN